MKGTHFSEEQMIRILHDAEATGNVRYAGHLYGVTWRSCPLPACAPAPGPPPSVATRRSCP